MKTSLWLLMAGCALLLSAPMVQAIPGSGFVRKGAQEAEEHAGRFVCGEGTEEAASKATRAFTRQTEPLPVPATSTSSGWGRKLATGGTVAAVGSAAVLDYAADHPGLTATALLAASHPEESISVIGWVLRHPFLSLGAVLLSSALYCQLVQLLRQSSQYALRTIGKRMGGEDELPRH